MSIGKAFPPYLMYEPTVILHIKAEKNGAIFFQTTIINIFLHENYFILNIPVGE